MLRQTIDTKKVFSYRPKNRFHSQKIHFQILYTVLGHSSDSPALPSYAGSTTLLQSNAMDNGDLAYSLYFDPPTSCNL